MPARWTRVPKAAVNKNRDPLVWKKEVRLPLQMRRVHPPTGDLRPHQRHPQCQFGSFIALCTNSGHSSGTNFIYVVEFAGPKALLEVSFH